MARWKISYDFILFFLFYFRSAGRRISQFTMSVLIVLFTFNINCLKSFFPYFTFWSNLLILFFCARQTNNFLCVNWEAHRNENFFFEKKKKAGRTTEALKHIVMYILVFFLLSQHFHNRKRKSYAKDIMLCCCSVPTNFRFLWTEIVYQW